MAFGKTADTAQAGLLRPLALLACALALGLLAWRGAALLTGPGAPVAATPAEAALADIRRLGGNTLRVHHPPREGDGFTEQTIVDYERLDDEKE